MKKRNSDNHRKLFLLFSTKPVTKDDEFAEIPTNFKGFFVMLGRKFWNISNLSLIYTFVNIPILFLLLGYGLRMPVTTVSGEVASSFYGLWNVSNSRALSSLFPFAVSFSETYVSSTASYVCYAISSLFVFTFGLANVGAAYVVRGYNRGDPVFIFSDFFATIKRNFKQGLIVGIADLFIGAVLIFDFLFWSGQAGFINGIFMYFALFLCVLYFFMRFYIYTITITFDLSVYKIFKDAFLLSFLGFKRNLVALFGVLSVFILNVFICTLYLPVGIMLPIVLTLGLGMFICGYASYPVIKKYMIDPYYPEDVNDSDGESDEPVFEDRG